VTKQTGAKFLSSGKILNTIDIAVAHRESQGDKNACTIKLFTAVIYRFS
jgi:hypothetical protein